jgi:hypothetical protein
MHFTPTSGSWLNMVEIFFGIITRQAIRRGTFTSVKPDFDQLVRSSVRWSRCRVVRMSSGSGSAAVTIWSPAWISMVW